MSNNFVTLTGNLCFETDMRHTSGDHRIAQNSIAVFVKKDPRTGDNISDFFDLKAWDIKADALAAFSVGDRVVITGKLSQERWEDRETGGNRSKVVVLCLSIAANPWEERGEGSGSTQQQSSAPPAAQQTPKSESQDSGPPPPREDPPDYDDIPF